MKPKTVQSKSSKTTDDPLVTDTAHLVSSSSRRSVSVATKNTGQQRRTDGRSNSSSCSWFCFNLGIFVAGVFTALCLSGAAYYGMYSDCHLSCREHDGEDGTVRGLGEAGLRDGQGLKQVPIDFIQPAPPLADSQAADNCVFTLVESIPQNLTYPEGEPLHPSTYSALKTLLSSAKRSINIASFYWTLRGQDIEFHDGSAQEGEDIFASLLELSKGNRVSLQIVQNAENNDTAILSQQGHAQVLTLNFTRLFGRGILHTKFWLVDGQHFYIGSANLDWRSLTQVKELGVFVQNCPTLGADLQKIFDVYWYLGKPDSSIPQSWPSSFNTNINNNTPVNIHYNATQAPVYLSSAPPQFCPSGRTKDLDAILDVINKAKEFIYIAVMDYSPTSLYVSHETYWPVIDDALREAAFNRRVQVRLLASKWLHTMKDMYPLLCSLSMIGHLHHPKAQLQVKLFEVPSITHNQTLIPFSRVNHNKYMVTDQHAYIGTSNWSEDYFLWTGGVGFVVNQPGNSSQNFRQQLYEVFNRDWNSENYTMPLICRY